MEAQTFDSIFDALADTPAEAANMKARAALLSALNARIRSWNVPQEAAASRLGITRPHLNDLVRGKLGNSLSMRSSIWQPPPGCRYRSGSRTLCEARERLENHVSA